MLKLNLDHIRVDIDKFNTDRISKETPVFVKHKADFKLIDKVARKYSKVKNLIVIGNGGSITSFWAYCKALNKSEKKVFLVRTMDPDYLDDVKKECGKKDSLVMVISKSGSTVGVLEALLAFDGYKTLVITSLGSALFEIAKKKKFEVVLHPDVGGRYSGTSLVAYIPARILGIDVRKVDKGARRMYKKCSGKLENNLALQLSTALYLLDFNGYDEIFMPVYSPRLEGFVNLIVQLIHESSGKEGKGQTIFGGLGPETQHHTNQRFFGGKKNVVGLFVKVDKFDKDFKTKVAAGLKKINLKDDFLNVLNNIPLSKAVDYEFEGTFRDAVRNKIPVCSIVLDKISEETIGEFMGLWHYMAVYSSLLRGVDPYDQPQVEASKSISFELRKQN
ncbi:MAG: hypothetical protein KAT77_00480 [Nanoarchaeota archaeon]|nr:hypothetical protein [Nanoarchaeota archaeon]